ncbi:hypothetical protein DPMN_144172 [Dreissena polymorpha]|uniref:Uncharacterized protein n=1 Tax=Dreissena polymorpha TaxID=45954 RepID=A0A9D4JMB7_DREPO|nr:hypothetical protein DPMN_144172 [Dreissena polymorpha]
MNVAKKIRRSVHKTIRKIRRQQTANASGSEQLLEPKDGKLAILKKFLADTLKRKKSHRRYENPFKRLETDTEINADKISACTESSPKMHQNSYTQSEHKTDTAIGDVTTGIIMSDFNTATPKRPTKTTCRRIICYDMGTPTERRGSIRCRQADGYSDVKIKQSHSTTKRRSGNSNITLVGIKIRKTPHTKHRQRSRSCCCRQRSCLRRQTSNPRSDRHRPSWQKDISEESDVFAIDTHNSILDKGFLQHESRIFDDRRRSIVDVLNIGYIAVDGSLVLSDETISKRCFTRLSTEVYSNAPKLECRSPVDGGCTASAHVSDELDGTINGEYTAGANGGFVCRYMRELCDGTMDRCEFETIASDVSSDFSSFEGTGHVTRRGIVFV